MPENESVPAELIGYKGISFPFRFKLGRLVTTTTSEESATHIWESIRQILGTSFGERRMRYKFGADINDLVFEPNDPVDMSKAAHMISKALEFWEPRVRVISLAILRLEDELVEMDISVFIKMLRKVETQTITVRRLI